MEWHGCSYRHENAFHAHNGVSIGALSRFHSTLLGPNSNIAGRHVAPLFAGGTVYAWSEIKDKVDLPGRSDVGALRIMTRATRDIAGSSFQIEDGAADKPGVILELDYWALMPG